MKYYEGCKEANDSKRKSKGILPQCVYNKLFYCYKDNEFEVHSSLYQQLKTIYNNTNVKIIPELTVKLTDGNFRVVDIAIFWQIGYKRKLIFVEVKKNNSIYNKEQLNWYKGTGVSTIYCEGKNDIMPTLIKIHELLINNQGG